MEWSCLKVRIGIKQYSEGKFFFFFSIRRQVLKGPKIYIAPAGYFNNNNKIAFIFWALLRFRPYFCIWVVLWGLIQLLWNLSFSPWIPHPLQILMLPKSTPNTGHSVLRHCIFRSKSPSDKCFNVLHRWIKEQLKRKLVFQGDGSLLIQELTPMLPFLPQITNNSIMVKFPRICFYCS